MVDVTPQKMNKDAQMRASINQKLIETGERERLKELLRAKLIECGWKDQLKAHCKGNCRLISGIVNVLTELSHKYKAYGSECLYICILKTHHLSVSFHLHSSSFKHCILDPVPSRTKMSISQKIYSTFWHIIISCLKFLFKKKFIFLSLYYIYTQAMLLTS
uniref:ENY2 transcription and export complex 2 subunit n=1 Tax=Podarcis muralis TaxID=64176 RepID=A0A670K3X7_PODMU